MKKKPHIAPLNTSRKVDVLLFILILLYLLAERREPYLLRQPIGGWEIAVTIHKHAADNEQRVVRRGYLRHAAWHCSLPALPRNEIVARLRASSARANVGKISAVRPKGDNTQVSFLVMRPTKKHDIPFPLTKLGGGVTSQHRYCSISTPNELLQSTYNDLSHLNFAPEITSASLRVSTLMTW